MPASNSPAHNSPAPAPDALFDEVREILTRRYRVNLHIAGSAEAARTSRGARRYAVWTGDKAWGTLRQVTEPTEHAEAQEQRLCLIINDILDLIEPQATRGKALAA